MSLHVLPPGVPVETKLKFGMTGKTTLPATRLLLSGKLEAKADSVHNLLEIEDADVRDFLARFAQATLPFCTDYSEAEMSFINPDDEDRFERRLEDYKPDSLVLSADEVQRFFLSGRDTVSVQNIWSTDTVARIALHEFLEDNTYFAGKLVIHQENFVGITFEILDFVHGSVKFFCTLDTNGKLISMTPVGFYTHSGSYARDDGTRGWWFPSQGACITENGEIKTYDFDHQINGEFEMLRLVEIQENGQLWKRYEAY